MNKKKAKVETNITRNPSPPELTPRYMPQPYVQAVGKSWGRIFKQAIKHINLNPGVVFSNRLQNI